MNIERENKLVGEWSRLRAQRAKLNDEFARLCYRIRNEFGAGAGGDAAMIEFVRVKCGEGRAAAEQACAIAAAWDAVGQSPDAWESLGGVESARVIAELPPRQAAAVISEALTEVEERKRPIGPHAVRLIAERRGYLEAKPRQLSTAAKLATFIARLYADHPDLPKPPREIERLVRIAAVRKRA